MVSAAFLTLILIGALACLFLLVRLEIRHTSKETLARLKDMMRKAQGKEEPCPEGAAEVVSEPAEVSEPAPALARSAVLPTSPPSSLDWSDPSAVSRWLASLRVSFDDADAVTRDMLRPACARELGPALHAKNYDDARAQILRALTYAEAPESDPEPNGPAGSGGTAPVH
jgi:hypothetical protein